MATENQALNAALGTDMTPAPFKEPDYSRIRTLPQVFAEEKRVGDLQAKAAGEMKQAELTQQANLAGEQAKAATQIADKAKTYVDDTHKKEAEFPYPEFHPTKDNAESLGGLFSIVSTLGIMLGSSGKQSGLNAMNAMTGMMNGWQKGRADLFKREKEEFDKEFNRIKVLREGLRKDLEDYMKLLPYDKEAAMYKAAEISAKTGSDSIINAYVKKGQADNALKLLDGAGKMIQHQEEMSFKRSEREEARSFRERQLNLQERRLDLQEKKKTDTGEVPKDAKTKEEYRARYEIVKNVEDIQSLLEDPKYSGLITPATKFTPDVVNNLRKNFPELSQKLARIQAIEFQIGGKSLTAKEQEILSPIYGWKGLTADALKSRLAGVKDSLQDTNDLTEVYYPGLKRIHSEFDKIYEQKGKVPAVPNVGSDIEAQAKKSFGSYEPDKYEYGYENGKFYRDKK